MDNNKQLTSRISEAFKLNTTDDCVYDAEALAHILAPQIERLLNNQHKYLMHICYRLDCDERLVYRALDTETPSLSLARVIIARQAARIQTLDKFKPKEGGLFDSIQDL